MTPRQAYLEVQATRAGYRSGIPQAGSLAGGVETANPRTMTGLKRIYEPSPRHCEPITAENPGVKCPLWSVAIAEELLEEAEIVGNALQATRDGIGFVGRRTGSNADGEIWHGYPEAWDRMDPDLKRAWLNQKVISRRDLRTYKTRRNVRDAFGGRLVGR